MTEPAPTPTPAAQPTESTEPTDPIEPTAEPNDGTDWKAEARKWEQRAKDNQKAARELEAQQRASMTEAERAVAEAEARGRTSAITDFGKRLARTSFDAAAARRNPDVDTTAVLEFVDLTRFVGDDGEPDSKAIAAAVERLVPAAQAGLPSFDGGARKSADKPADMNQLIRRQVGIRR